MTSPEAYIPHVSARPSVVVPEDDVVFRLAQLVLLLTSLRRNSIEGATLERLSYYDFFVANPLLVLTDEADPDRLDLLLAGFDSRALMYASPSQRFTSRRERLQHDLALLVSYGLATVGVDKGVRFWATEDGVLLAGQFTAIYSRAYRASADILVKRLSRLTDKRLRDSAQEWVSVSATSAGRQLVEAIYCVDLLSAENELVDSMREVSDE